jgi:hypothetical protein
MSHVSTDPRYTTQCPDARETNSVHAAVKYDKDYLDTSTLTTQRAALQINVLFTHE